MVVAVHEGTPFKKARVFPAVPAGVVASAEDPFPYGMTPAAIAAQPVPPFPMERIPVMSEARFTRAVVTAPVVALRKPVSEPMERFEVKRFVELAVVEKKEVVVAATAVTPPVAFTENRFTFALF